jgi:hypothetical protein
MTNDDIFDAKTAKYFKCNLCDFKCCKQSNWNNHILTRKHKKNNNELQNDYNLDHENAITKFTCDCGKNYKHRQGLWKHKQVCKKKCISQNNTQPDNNEIIDSNLVIQLLKQNDEFKSMLIEQNNKMIETIQEVCKSNNTNNSNIVNNTNINSNNKAFNLNVFLNETCKDAMDINDFIDSVKLQLSDLELVGKLGFVDGISSIIIKNLKALKVSERPVHCTDLKRETMYVKEQGIWEKQEGDYKNLRKVIKRIAFKNSKNLSLYKELHPDYNDYYSKHSDHYLKLQIEAFGGSGNETIDNENKIIKKIAKEMAIDKSL